MLIQFVPQSKNILELGTGQGAGGARVMSVLASDAVFTTINYADGHVFGEQLDPWGRDSRLHRLYADTIDPKTLLLVSNGVDLLYIDTTHEAWHAATELRLWQDKLRDCATVVVDDLNQHDMMTFWNSLPYEKVVSSFQGMFRYDASRRYETTFARLSNTTYGGDK